MTILAVLVVAANAMVSALVVISAPTASAETPAERCARETAAYNSAWAQSWAASNGKPADQAPPPPVPYVCVDPGPPTSSTTPPPSVTAPTIPTETTTPDTGGPNMGAHAPTDIPDAGRTPIVPIPGGELSATTKQPTPSATPPSSAAGEQTPTTRVEEHRPPTSNRGPALTARSGFCGRIGVHCARTPLGDALEGKLLSPPDGSRLWSPNFRSCPEGQHKSNTLTGTFCYSDYDYVIRNVQHIGSELGSAPVAHAQCGVETTRSSELAAGAETTIGRSVDGGADINLGSVGSISGSISDSFESTTSTEESTGIESKAPTMDPAQCPPGRKMIARQYYEIYSYDLDVVDTRSGQVVGRITGNRTIVWSQSVEWELQ
ncbi:hypothetical protein [Gordonia paraffinivorans]|uniref:hypothetical protein n=1 Tax=Gordonia paraffinivorans TaxID=175628 RepID=UPI001E493ACF|nr:hypothetical protein [Gordonia paraffinivorans]MCD2147543.1 hypothetical protein [Gordonia paraffinivorans]